MSYERVEKFPLNIISSRYVPPKEVYCLLGNRENICPQRGLHLVTFSYEHPRTVTHHSSGATILVDGDDRTAGISPVDIIGKRSQARRAQSTLNTLLKRLGADFKLGEI